MSEAGWPAIVAHRERLLAIARRRCPTREDAEDVVHEAMIRCATFANLDEKRLGQFLTTVTIRLCADLYRDADRTTRITRKLAPERSEVPGPEDAACTAAATEVLVDLLARLPDRQRAVLVDRADGMSVPQICNRHALTYKAAESALSRARNAMRAALASAVGLVTAFVASTRPARRGAAIALPVVTLVAVGTVLRLPAGPGSAPQQAPRPGYGAVTTLRSVADQQLRHGAPRVAAAVPRMTAIAHRSAVVAHRQRPAVKREVLKVTDPLGGRTEVSDDGNQTPEELVAACLSEGPYVQVEVTRKAIGWKSGCGGQH